nr:hypothetical protein [Saprospiraceae bacterium]
SDFIYNPFTTSWFFLKSTIYQNTGIGNLVIDELTILPPPFNIVLCTFNYLAFRLSTFDFRLSTFDF